MRLRARLRRPFLVTLDRIVGGATLAGALACGGESSSSEQPTTRCPEAPPGGACHAAPDLVCDYAGSPCGTSYQCVGGKWTPIPSSCNPPPPECPPDTTPLPEPGASCPPGWGTTTCTFRTSCGLPGTATCDGTAYHHVFDPCLDAGVEAAADAGAEADSDAATSGDADASGA